jgi:hypothetical protein
MDFVVVNTGDEMCSHISKYCPKGLCKTRESFAKGVQHSEALKLDLPNVRYT